MADDAQLRRPVRVGGDRNFPPFEFIARPGHPEGLYVDLTRAIVREMGLDVEFVLGPWDELEEALVRGDLDVIQGTVSIPEREEHLEFSQPHTTVHYVSVVRRGDAAPPTAIGTLTGKRIAVQRGSLMHQFAEFHGLGEPLSVVETLRDALQQLLLGRSDVALVPLYTARYFIDREEWSELLTIGQPLASREHRYAVAGGRAELLAQLDEGLRIMVESGEYRHIRDQWVPAGDEQAVGLGVILRYVAMVAVPLVLLLVAFLVWARILRRQVLQRTAELRQSEIQFRQIAENLADIIWLGDMATGRLLYINPAFERLSGRSPQRLYGKSRSFLQVVQPADRRVVGVAFRRLENGEINEFDLEHRILRPDGEVRWVHTRSYPIRNYRGVVIRNAGVATDITERKMAEEAFRAGEERAHLQRSAMARLLADEVVAAGELPEALWRVLEILTGTIGVARAGVWTLSADGSMLECRALLTPEGRSGAVPPLDVTSMPHYFGAIRDEGRVYCEHAQDDDRTSDLTDSYLRPLGITSMLDAGIQLAGELAGVVCTEHVGPPRRWYPDEEAFVTTLAAVVAQILTNARRRAAEARLRESEDRFRTLADHIPGVVYLCRNDERYSMLYLNDAVEQLTGYPRGHFLTGGASFVDLYHPDDTAGVFSSVDRALEAREPFHMVYRMRHAAGQWRWVEEWGVGVFDGDRLRFLEGFIADITQRKMAEERLRDSEARARVLFDGSPDAVFVIGPDGRYVEVNPVALERYGYTREQFLAMGPAELAASDLRDQVAVRLDEARCTERRFDWRHRTRDGREIPVAVITRPIVFDGRDCVLVSARDISERVQLEDQLRQSQKMEAVGTLAGGVAHDFNNMLQAMMTQLHLIDLKNGDCDQIAKIITELEQHVRHGASLTRQLLLFSRRETATLARCDLNEIVRNSTVMLRRLIRENVSFTLECHPEPLMVNFDRGQMEQVLMNLVVNASQAMPNGGTLTVSTAPEGDQTVALEVADTGRGIPPELRERIFEPFFTTRAAEHGTGLGLAVVHGIVTRHRGRIEVSSAVGRGSTFRVLVPRCNDRADRTPDTGAALLGDLEQGRGERILVVEDEDAAREGLREILVALGYRVTAVDSAEKVKELLDQAPFDLLLTDLVLPGIQGLDLAAFLCRYWPDLRVILMSGYSQEDVVRRGASDGTLHFLQKPFDMDTLAREIRAALSES